MAIDREATLKNAEKFLRVGRLDAAIAEYARVVDEYPRDLTTANTLGDLYLRSAQSERAVALYQRIADHLLAEGFYPKAAALLKKILKITPEDEAALIHLGEISARQGLLADAKGYFGAVAARRRRRGDTRGADEIVVRLGALDPGDVAARRAAADALERRGDAAGAAAVYAELYAELLEKGRAEDADLALRDWLRCAPGDPPADMLWPVTGLHLREGQLDAARSLLPRVLDNGPSARDAVLELAWTLVERQPDAAALCIEVVTDRCVASGEFADAAAVLQEFAARVPGQVGALLRLVEVCVDGGLEAIMYEAQAQLADAYLSSGRPDEARVIAEDLVSREPWESAHVDRLRRALQTLNVAGVEAIIAERLAAPTHEETESFDDVHVPEPARPPEPAVSAPVQERPPLEETHEEPVEPDEPAPRPAAAEIDLTSALGELDAQHPAPAAPRPTEPPRDLEDVFSGIRATVASAASADECGEHFDLARTYLDMGLSDEAVPSLEIAARSPRHRFEAAALLARVFRDRGDLPHAVEWYERAAEAPSQNIEDGRALLYDLGDVLEMLGETARALAVFMELNAEASAYRDVPERIARLSDDAGG